MSRLISQYPPLDGAYIEASHAIAPQSVENLTASLPICPCPSWKRAMDVMGASLLLVVLLPLLGPLAVWIKVVSPGPIFFRQLRYGLGGRPFRLWKFRTFQTNEADGTQRAYMANFLTNERPMIKRDLRSEIIPGGRLLRQFGIDELPQLINVLNGEMSLVGPRPHVVPFQSYAGWQRSRFEVLPGITGLWQVSGKEGTSFTTMIRMDLDYIRRRSLWLDLKILMQTIPAIARG